MLAGRREILNNAQMYIMGGTRISVGTAVIDGFIVQVASAFVVFFSLGFYTTTVEGNKCRYLEPWIPAGYDDQLAVFHTFGIVVLAGDSR